MAQTRLFNWYGTDDAPAFPGLKANTSVDVCDSYTAEEGINPGDAVMRGSADGLCKPITSNTDADKIIGIAVHVHREPQADGGAYYEAGYCLPVMSFGDIYVRAGGDVHVGDPVGITTDEKGQAFTAATASTVTAGSRTYSIGTNFADGDTLTVEGVTLTAKAADAAEGQFNIGKDAAASAAAVVTALQAEKSITDVYDVTGKDATFTLTEKQAGDGHTPDEAATTGTGKVFTVATTGSQAASDGAVKGLTLMQSGEADDTVRIRVRL